MAYYGLRYIALAHQDHIGILCVSGPSLRRLYSSMRLRRRADSQLPPQFRRRTASADTPAAPLSNSLADHRALVAACPLRCRRAAIRWSAHRLEPLTGLTLYRSSQCPYLHATLLIPTFASDEWPPESRPPMLSCGQGAPVAALLTLAQSHVTLVPSCVQQCSPLSGSALCSRQSTMKKGETRI